MGLPKPHTEEQSNRKEEKERKKHLSSQLLKRDDSKLPDPGLEVADRVTPPRHGRVPALAREPRALAVAPALDDQDVALVADEEPGRDVGLALPELLLRPGVAVLEVHVHELPPPRVRRQRPPRQRPPVRDVRHPERDLRVHYHVDAHRGVRQRQRRDELREPHADV